MHLGPSRPDRLPVLRAPRPCPPRPALWHGRPRVTHQDTSFLVHLIFFLPLTYGPYLLVLKEKVART
ncbi:hypothetical protein SORBI_3007G085900 [Sorghum bicolor]|uniref:Uncharacterized protein n=1 Tax=Sorghum bicolor TaxID=4558 RepID=C5YJD7_SORBI|nr:hypothetical protein SORBI_3007G085900 [Sorghum bicolor]